jgi:hypothetical protein
VIASLGLIILPRYLLGNKGYFPASDKVNVGIVGAEGQSIFSTKEISDMDDVQITTIIDTSEIWKNDIL